MVEGPPRVTGSKPSAMDPLIGKVLSGRFTILERIGAGGMGTVYKAVQSPLDRVVALKVLKDTYSRGGKDPGFQKRFLLEASMTSKLHHPNTITVIDYGKTDDGIFYLAMEYVEGVTLAQLLKEQPQLPWPRAFNITQQIARSLREAHRLGIIHRDLKPANVMVLNEETDSDLVKVLDFGLVKSFLPEKMDGPHTQLTQAGVLLASPRYMAPEQARNQADPRSDVYSLGVVLYQMLAGRVPFTAKQPIDAIYAHLNEPPPPLREIAPDLDLPDAGEDLVMRCLSKNPDERYQSMDDLLEALREVCSSAGITGVFSRPRGDGPSAPFSQVTAASTRSQGLRPTGFWQSSWRWLMLPLFLFVGIAAVLLVGRKSPVPQEAPAETRAERPEDPATPPSAAQARAEREEPTRPEPPNAEPPRTPSSGASVGTGMVKFRIESRQRGVRVSMNGKDLGKTPVEVEAPPGSDGVAEVPLTFSMDGYQKTEYLAHGKGPQTTVTAPNLPRLPKEKPKRPIAPGYKDDPYQ